MSELQIRSIALVAASYLDDNWLAQLVEILDEYPTQFQDAINEIAKGRIPHIFANPTPKRKNIVK